MIKPLKYIVLLLTTACNLKCAYCYRGGTASSSQKEHAGIDNDSFCMPRSTIEKIILLAGESGSKFHVQLTGGEPTFEPELIKWTIDCIQKHNFAATIGIQTNGTIIDTSLIRMFREHNIQVGVSLDGVHDIQEKLRGKSILTLKGLKLLSNFCIPFQVTCVVTEHNAAHLDRLALLLGSFGSVRGIGLDLLVCKGRAVKGNCVYPCLEDDLRKGIKKLLQALAYVNRHRSNPIKLRELEALKRSYALKKSTSFCYAMTDEAIAVHPDGRIYPCAQLIDDPVFAMGDINNLYRFFQQEKTKRFCNNKTTGSTRGGINVSYDNSAQKSRLNKKPPKQTLHHGQCSHQEILNLCTLENDNCRKCPVFGFCPGDCPARLYYNDDDTVHLACIMYQTLWEEYKKVDLNI